MTKVLLRSEVDWNNDGIFNGVPAAARTVLDTFLRADAATLGRTELRTGPTWVNDQGTWAIATNRAYASSGALHDQATADLAATNHTAEATITSATIATVGAGVTFRGIDAANTLYAYAKGAAVTLWKKVAGVHTQLATAAFAFTNGIAYTVRAEVRGTAVTIRVNGTILLTYTLAGADATMFGVATATRCGLLADSAAAYFTNFAARSWTGATPTVFEEDVSGRLRDAPGVTSTRGRDTTKSLPPPMAGTSNRDYGNISRDYSTELAATPLFSYLDGGRLIRDAESVAYDNVARADSASSIGAPDYAPYGGSYTGLYAILAGTWGVASNAICCPTPGAGDNAAAVLDCVLPDAILDVTLSVVADKARLIARASDVDNCLALEVNVALTRYDIRKRVAGVWSTLGNVASVPAAGDRLLLTVKGSKVEASVNGVTTSVTETFNQTATKHGIGAGTGASGARFTALRAWVPYATGILDDLPQHASPQVLSVSAPALGVLTRLIGKTVKAGSPVYGDGTDAGGVIVNVAMGYIFDAAGDTDASMRVFDTCYSILQYFWIAPTQDLFQLALMILDTEGPPSTLFEDSWGRKVLKNRRARDTEVPSTVSQATLSGSGTEPLYSDIDPNRGKKAVVNNAVYEQKTLKLQALAPIWNYGETLTLLSNEVRTLNPVVSSPNLAFLNAVVPVISTDYTLSGGSIVSMSLDRTSGATNALTITAGATGATIAGPTGSEQLGITMRAQPLTVWSTTLFPDLAAVGGAASIAKYGLQPYALPVWPYVSAVFARTFASAVVGHWKTPRARSRVTIKNDNPTRLTQIQMRAIGELVTVIEPQTGINTAMWIERISRKVAQGGRWTEAIWECAESGGYRFFTLNRSLLNGQDLLGW